MNNAELHKSRKKLKDAVTIIRHLESHIGLINIETRLVLTFGKDYGLTIESALDQGTNVIVLIPLMIRRTEHLV